MSGRRIPSPPRKRRERKSNFLDHILSAIADNSRELGVAETIEGCVIGRFGASPEEERLRIGVFDETQRNVVVGEAEMRRWLNYNYDAGFGMADCHAVHVWTTHSVYFVKEFDGSTMVMSVPRHPSSKFEPQLY